jgi:hypothetical protein
MRWRKKKVHSIASVFVDTLGSDRAAVVIYKYSADAGSRNATMEAHCRDAGQGAAAGALQPSSTHQTMKKLRWRCGEEHESMET